ncbi:Iron transport multicopper oxidase FET3 [Orchesella cincta]|uniref:Iron transport multicopper oxidase FET3 n=1 Tax=Orchesella cincta TaxID=48709 RepID=A0A1D2N426_ORCCI|nr:Iron transport multicopper oxidase FET3 [Orchesella cincta]
MACSNKYTLTVPSLLVLASLTVNAKIVRHTFEVSYITGQPDGVWTKSILGINGKFPGPTIEGAVGDVAEITVINKIHDGQNVTIHWHGIHQRGTPFEDGPSQITQCPLKQGSTQVYKFILTEPGTYWYHSHVNSQYSEGLWGSIIVRSPRETWQSLYDEEILVTLNDWYHTSAIENEHWFVHPESLGAPPFPFSVLMNGVGRYPCDKAKLQSRLCDVEEQKRPVFRLQANKRTRLRLVSTSGWVAFNFTVEGHRLQPIEVDGIDLAVNQQVPQAELDQAVFIGAGQRYSFILIPEKGKNKTGSEFLIRANLRREYLFTRPGNINAFPNALITEVTGVMRYSADDPASQNSVTTQITPQLISPSFESFDYLRKYEAAQPWSSLRFIHEMNLKTFDGIPAPSDFHRNVVLRITFQNDWRGIKHGSFNGNPFKLPHGKPLLGKFGRIGDGPYDPRRHKLNLNGHKRDTVLVKEKSYLVIRFLADNPGVWTLHCHIDWHNLTGMAMTFVEAPELAACIRVPMEAKKVCADHNVTISDNMGANMGRRAWPQRTCKKVLHNHNHF